MANTQAYDVTLQMRSVSAFLDTAQADFSQSSSPGIDLSAARHCRVVAIVGSKGVGKTFLLNKLFSTNLPSGKMHETTSLSFHWAESKGMLVVDTPGMHAAVEDMSVAGTEDETQPVPSPGGVAPNAQNASRSPHAPLLPLDAQATEDLLLSVITRVAHIIIFVVNDLQRPQQETLAALREQCAQQHAQLIVVHNWYTTSAVEEAKWLISKLGKVSRDSSVSTLGNLIFTTGGDERMAGVPHIGLCQEGSNAGGTYNKSNLDILWNFLNYRSAHGSEVTLAKRLAHEFERALPDVVTVSPPETRVAVHFTPTPTPCLKLEVPTGATVAVRRISSAVSKLEGKDFMLEAAFEPALMIYDQATPGAKRRIIEIEAPGVRREDIEVNQTETGVEVTMNKRRRFAEGGVEGVEPLMQRHGKWAHTFDFQGKHQVIVGRDGVVLEDGVLRITMRPRPSGQRLVISGPPSERSSPQAPSPGELLGNVGGGMRQAPGGVTDDADRVAQVEESGGEAARVDQRTRWVSGVEAASSG